MTTRGDWLSRLGWSTQQTPFERVELLLRESVVEQYGPLRASDATWFAHRRVGDALNELRKYIEDTEADLRLHKEERIRLRGEVMRLEQSCGRVGSRRACGWDWRIADVGSDADEDDA